MLSRFPGLQNAAASRRKMSLSVPATSMPACRCPADSATRRDGTTPSQPRPMRRAQFPARGNATEPIPKIAWRWGRTNSSKRSSPAPFICIQQTAQLADLLRRRLAASERVHHQLTRRTLENPLQHVPGKLLLGLLSRQACFIDVGPLRFVSAHRALCGHNLQKLQHCRVAEVFFLAEIVVHFADRRRSAVPENAENFEFRSGRFVRRLLHGKEHTTKMFVVSTKSS